MKKILFLLLFAGSLYAQSWQERLQDTLREIERRVWVPEKQVNDKIGAFSSIMGETLEGYATDRKVDSLTVPEIKYLSNIQNEYLDWGLGFTFYAILQDTANINFENVTAGKSIQVVIENPLSYPVSFVAPSGTSLIWKDGSVPTQADSSVDVWAFNAVGNYILGERKGTYKLPYIAPPDTSSPAPVGSEYYVNTALADFYYVNPTKQQILNGTTLPVDPVQIPRTGLLVKLAKDEYEPFSFLIKPKVNIADITTTVSNLVSGSDTIHSSQIDPYYMGIWWQENFNYEGHNAAAGVPATPQLIQELLIKDPELIRYTSTQYNDQIKGTETSTGSIGYRYINATEFTNAFKIQDANTLVPCTIDDALTRQLYFIAHTPSTQPAGTYVGQILQTYNNGGSLDTLAIIPLTIEVRNFVLPVSRWVFGLYNDTYYSPSSWASNWYKAAKDSIQFDIELNLLLENGIRYPQMAQGGGTYFPITHRFMDRLGFPTDKRFLHGTSVYFTGYLNYLQYQAGLPYATPQYTRAQCISYTVGFRALAIADGFSMANTYFYGADEASMASSTGSTLDDMVSVYNELEANYGMKFYAAIAPYGDTTSTSSNFYVAKNSLDIPVIHFNHENKDGTYPISRIHANLTAWENYAPVYVYNYPQAGKPIAENYRRNGGFMLFTHGVQGAFQWKQGYFNNIWYDYDGYYPDPAIYYPTYHGAIRTVSLEGTREGIDDTRYLTKMLDILDTLSDATAKATAESWLNNTFKNWCGDMYDRTALPFYPNGGINADSLDFLRDTVAGYINYLYAGDFTPPVSTDSLVITIDPAYIEGTLTDFPITLDMANLPAAFWSGVTTVDNVYFKDAAGNKLNRYITGFDASGHKGVAYFKASTLSDANNTFSVFWDGSGEPNASGTFRSEYALFMGMNEDYNALVDYADGNTISIGTTRTSDDKITGKIGYAADFDNTYTDSISVAYTSSLAFGTDDLTISVFTNINAGETSTPNIVSDRIGTAGEGYHLRYDVTNTYFNFRLYNSGAEVNSSTSSLADGNWHYVACAIDRGTTLAYYIDGTAAGTGTALNAYTSSLGGATFLIGANRNSSTYNLWGAIDELRVYRGYLSSDWLKTEYNNLNNQATFFQSIE